MILLISDFHKHKKNVLALIKKYQPTFTICCGDGEVNEDFYFENNIISVLGNCDNNDFPLAKIIEIYGKKAIITHGHLFNVCFDLERLYLMAKENDCEYVFYGHTHVQSIVSHDNITFVNPGSMIDNKYAIILEDEIILK